MEVAHDTHPLDEPTEQESPFMSVEVTAQLHVSVVKWQASRGESP